MPVIAAERGYPFLIVKREKFWNAMDAAERERAVVLRREALGQLIHIRARVVDEDGAPVPAAVRGRLRA